MSAIHLQLLGDFCLTYDGKPVANIDTPRLRALVAYLTLHRHAPQARHHLAFTFWPDTSEAQALTNLRKQLLYLRNALPAVEVLVQVARQTIQWSPAAEFGLDVAEFAAILERAATIGGEQAVHLLCQAIALYRGDLLPECYDEWILATREALRGQYSDALTRLVQLLEAQRDYPAAIVRAQQLLRHDALHEPTYRTLMRLHTLNGDRATALRIYHTCVTQLREELGVEPDAETQATYERLLQQPSSLELQHPVVATAPFVGRKAEWQLIQQTWRKAAHGQCQFVLIAGEAGIGKTRLAEEVLDWAAHQGMATARSRSYAAEGRLAYAPVIELVRADALHPQLRQLDAAWLTELARLLPELLTEQPALPRPEPLTQGWQRRHLFEALARAVLAGDKPLLLLLDDLQWCDQETLEWLHFLLRFVPSVDRQKRGWAQLLIIGTARAEEMKADHPLTALLTDLRGGDQLTELDLAPLNAVETAELACSLNTEILDASAAAQLYRNTEGNPLFVVETVRAGLSAQRTARKEQTPESNPPSPVSSPPFLPPKIQAIIKARLAQLSPQAHQVATLAAIIGREFTFDVLVAASQDNGTDLVDALDELWQRRIIREQGFQAYDFSHDRIREVAAAEVSVARRRHLHRSVAQALTACYADQLDTVAARVAAHYEAAGMTEQAIYFYEQATESARRVYANHETITLLQRALELLKLLPESQARDQRELTFLNVLGPLLSGVTEFNTTRLREVYERAHVLSQQLGVPSTPGLLRILAIHKIGERNFEQVQMLGRHFLELAQKPSAGVDPVLYVEGCYVMGVAAFWQGHFMQAKAYLQQAVDTYSTERQERHIAEYGQATGAYCRTRLAWTLWYLGFPDQARQQSEAALTFARKAKHPFTLHLVSAYSTWLACDCRDVRAAEAGVRLLNTYPDSMSSRKEGVFRFLDDWCRLLRGEIQASITRLCDYIALRMMWKSESIYGAHVFTILVEAYRQAGDYEQGLSAVAEAFALLGGGQECCHVAELYRLKGELLMGQGGQMTDAEACFQQAIEIARRQEAKSLELRAAMSLSRLWVQRGKQPEAHALLAEVYNWFTEGFDTPDLIDARALLAGLG